MKYFALFSICFYLVTIFFLKEKQRLNDESYKEEDQILKSAPQNVLLDPKSNQTKKSLQRIVQPNIKKEFLKKVVQTFPKTMQTTLTALEEVNLYKNGKNIKALKLLISHQKEDGQKSSYHALVNQETGQVLETFNRPHIEPKKDFGLRYKGKI